MKWIPKPTPAPRAGDRDVIFAFRPVKCNCGTWVWLENVERVVAYVSVVYPKVPVRYYYRVLTPTAPELALA